MIKPPPLTKSEAFWIAITVLTTVVLLTTMALTPLFIFPGIFFFFTLALAWEDYKYQNPPRQLFLFFSPNLGLLVIIFPLFLAQTGIISDPLNFRLAEQLVLISIVTAAIAASWLLAIPFIMKEQKFRGVIVAIIFLGIYAVLAVTNLFVYLPVGEL
jgi:hypothetical protein